VFASFFPAGLELAEHEDVFWAVDALEGGEDCAFAALTTFVAQGGERFSIAFAGKDGLDDGLGAKPVNITEDVMKLEVHFGEDFLHPTQGVGGFLLEAMTVASEVA